MLSCVCEKRTQREVMDWRRRLGRLLSYVEEETSCGVVAVSLRLAF